MWLACARSVFTRGRTGSPVGAHGSTVAAEIPRLLTHVPHKSRELNARRSDSRATEDSGPVGALAQWLTLNLLTCIDLIEQL